MNQKIPTQKFEGWAILEVMGHRKLGGFVTEVEIAGHGFLRIDIPAEGDTRHATQFYQPTSIYCVTPTTEPMARAIALRNKPQPVQRWELPQIERRVGQTLDTCECGHSKSDHEYGEECSFSTCSCRDYQRNNVDVVAEDEAARLLPF